MLIYLYRFYTIYKEIKYPKIFYRPRLIYHLRTGVAGFEPTHEGVKVPCLTAWLYPNDEMEREGFEPPNPKERIYSPPRLASSLSLRIQSTSLIITRKKWKINTLFT